MKIFLYPPNAKPPEALQLTRSPAEVFPHLQQKVRDMEHIMLLNEAVRGQVRDALRSRLVVRQLGQLLGVLLFLAGHLAGKLGPVGGKLFAVALLGAADRVEPLLGLGVLRLGLFVLVGVLVVVLRLSVF